jgi:hypothetical protein
MWVVSVVAGLGAGACNSAHSVQTPIESPLGEIQAAGAPRTIVRINEDMRDQQWLRDIAIVGNDLYVTVAWSGAYRLPKYGGGITALDQGTNVEFDELASGDGAVFWQALTFDGNDFPTTHLRRVAEGDVEVSTIYQANLATYGDSRGKNLQVDGSTVYLTQVRNVTDQGAIHRIPATGGAELAPILPFTVPGAGPVVINFPTTWILRNGGVLYADCSAGGGSCAIQQVTGDGARTIATVPGDEAYVQYADETSLYVTTMFHVAPPPDRSIPISLLKIDPQSGAAFELTPDSGGAYWLLGDDRELFFVSGAFAIEAISKQGGDQRLVADLTGSHGIWRMAQDDTYLFVLTANSEVIAIPKGTPAQP